MKRRTFATMDAAGRLVLPRAIREQAQLEPGTPLRITCRDGRVEIEPVAREVRLLRKGGLCVAVPFGTIEPLRSEKVRDTVASLRSRKG